MGLEAKNVGLVGLGLVGKAIAGRLIAAGCRVLGYDIDADARAAGCAIGVDVGLRLSDMAKAGDVIVLSLPDSRAVARVLWGDDGIARVCREGTTILDTTTAKPTETVLHHRKLKELGIRFVDVTLVGSSQEIARGQAIALVGDIPGAGSYADLVGAFASRVFFLGGVGQGNVAKLVVNLVLGLNRLALAEGLALSKKTGLDCRVILEILKAGAAYSRVMDTKGERMISGDFEPVARLAQHGKDVQLILDLAAEVGGCVPVSRLHWSLLERAIQAGWGELDNAAIIKIFAATEGDK